MAVKRGLMHANNSSSPGGANTSGKSISSAQRLRLPLEVVGVHHLPQHPVFRWATDDQTSVPDCGPRDAAHTLHSATAKSTKISRDMTLDKMGTMCTDLLPESRAKGDKNVWRILQLHKHSWLMQPRPCIHVNMTSLETSSQHSGQKT